MKLQTDPKWANSEALRVEGVNAVSVVEKAPATGPAWLVVPHATKPGARVAVATAAADILHVPPTGTVASNLITPEAGLAGVSVLLIRSFCTESETKPLGVTGQEQQEAICSSKLNVYTLTQKDPRMLAVVPDWFVTPPLAPVFDMSTKESGRAWGAPAHAGLDAAEQSALAK